MERESDEYEPASDDQLDDWLAEAPDPDEIFDAIEADYGCPPDSARDESQSGYDPTEH